MERSRYDAGEQLGPPITRRDGARIYDAVVARTGVIAYPWGREYTPPEVLQAAAETMTGMGVVAPREDSITHPENFRDLAERSSMTTGVVTPAAFRDGTLRARVVIDREDGLRAIDERGLVELSPTYDTDVVREDGVSPDGEPYTHRRTRIDFSGGHLLMLPPGTGRQGPDVRFRADSLGTPATPQEGPTMAKVTINGAEYEMPDGAATAVTGVLSKLETETQRADSLGKQLSEAQGALAVQTKRADSIDTERAQWLKERDEVKPVADRLSVAMSDEAGMPRALDAVRRDCVAAHMGDEAWKSAKRYDSSAVTGAFRVIAPSTERADSSLRGTFTSPKAGVVNEIGAALASFNGRMAGQEV